MLGHPSLRNHLRDTHQETLQTPLRRHGPRRRPAFISRPEEERDQEDAKGTDESRKAGSEGEGEGGDCGEEEAERFAVLVFTLPRIHFRSSMPVYASIFLFGT